MEEVSAGAKTKFSQYFKAAGAFLRVPDNPYGHSFSLLSAKGRSIQQASEFSDLEDPNAFLGFVDNDNMIRFYQKDAMLLENLFSMGKESRSIFKVFSVLYHGWKFGIRLTANKGGIERKLQHPFTGEGPGSDGFGKSWQKEEERQRKLEAENGNKLGGGMYG